MPQVTHTVKWQYGPGSGKTQIRVDEDTEMPAIIARVRRIEGLNYLAMCSESFKVVATVRHNEESED